MTTPGVDQPDAVPQLPYNPFDPSVIADPYPAYAYLLGNEPVFPLPMFSAWVLVRWDDVRQVLLDRRFSAMRQDSTFVQGLAPLSDETTQRELDFFTDTLLTMDPPDHTRLRRLVSKAFTPTRVNALTDRIGEVTHELCDELAERGSGDLMQLLAVPLPVIVISELLGLPSNDRQQLKRWSDDIATLLDPFPAQAALEAFVGSLREFRGYLTEHFEARRKRRADDLIGALVEARDGDDALTDDELFAMVVLLLAAGHETTTNLIGNSVIALTRHRDQRRRFISEPNLIGNAIEELLRFDSPVQRTSRVATEPVEMHGVEMAPGDLLLLILGAANHDPAQFPEPERLDLGRANAGQHLSFGHGIHFCIGAPLARIEGRVALTAVFERFPNLDADIDDLNWKPSIILRGVSRLPFSIR